MPFKLLILLFILLLSIFGFGCRHSEDRNKPVIYDAWSARYQYNPMSRELFSVSENKPIGRSWSRDSLGRLDSIYFYSGVDGRDENLFQFHQKNLDKKRDREWEADRESRIFQLEEIMRMRDSNETEVSEEQIGEGNVEDPFVPEIEIPSMINTVPTAPDSSAEPDPFAPIDPSPVESSPEESPFAPLPAIP